MFHRGRLLRQIRRPTNVLVSLLLENIFLPQARYHQTRNHHQIQHHRYFRLEWEEIRDCQKLVIVKTIKNDW